MNSVERTILSGRDALDPLTRFPAPPILLDVAAQSDRAFFPLFDKARSLALPAGGAPP